jgi:aminoglycoside phosphotransferase (APT) family kinase protein
MRKKSIHIAAIRGPSGPPARPAAPDSLVEVQHTLVGFLRGRFPGRSLAFECPPEPISDGWETYIYHFQLRPSGRLPPLLDRPLTLRIYASPEARKAALHEHAVLTFLYRRGFPVPKPILFEQSCDYFGGPFLILERVAGQTLAAALRSRPLLMYFVCKRMANAHARLHDLPVANFPAGSGSFLERYLGAMATTIRRDRLPELRAGLDWVVRHAPPEPERPSILHLDYHPFNLMRRPDGELIVLDWPEAEVGDAHADVATTLVLCATVRAPAARFLDKVLNPIGKFFLTQWYVRGYRERRPLDEDKLAYYCAAVALNRLCRYGQWLKHDDCCKPSLLRQLTPEHVCELEMYFHSLTGVEARLPCLTDRLQRR